MPEIAPSPATVDLDALAFNANMHHAAAESSARRALESALEAGKHLAAAKAAVRHGEWLPWLRANFNGSARSASSYIRLQANRQRVAEFGGSIREALAMLAEDGAPPATAGELDLGPAPSSGGDVSRGTRDDDVDPAELAAGPSPSSSSSTPAPDPTAGIGKRTPLMSSQTDEWTTPEHVWRTALDALELDAFDLDPCAEAPTPKGGVAADHHYRIEDDGLAQEWHGVVFMNPPYSEIGQWVTKLREEFDAGRCVDFAALVPARVDTAWWGALTAGDAGTVVFVEGRLKFGGGENPAPFPSALVFGCTDANDVVAACAELGRAWKPM